MAYVAAAESLSGGTATLTLTRTVKDSVLTAWGESESLVLHDRADAAFFEWHAKELEPLIHEQLQDFLADEWAKRGRHVEWVDDVAGLPLEDGLATADIHAAWDAAASRLDVADLVSAAGLKAEYATWRS